MNRSHESIPPPYTGTTPSTVDLSERSPYLRSTPTASLLSPPYKTEAFLPGRRHHQRQGFFSRNIGLWRAIPCALAAIFWSAQMIYFLFYFTSRPAEPDGSWPRVGPSYAAFPFISCIGAIRELSFKSVSIVVAILLWLGFGTDYVLGSRSRVAIWWRRGKLAMASISGVFLIALSFSSVDEHHKLHLIFTSFQIMCMGMSKVCDWHLARKMRQWTPNNEFMNKVRIWKRIAATVAGPCSIIAVIGIYGCTAKFEGGKVVFTSVCWSLVSFAAPAEWVLSWCWVIFLGTISYDNYHLNYTIHLLLSAPPPPKARSYGLAFWKSWTERKTHDSDKTKGWEKERQRLTEAAAPLAGESTFKLMGVPASNGIRGQQPVRPRPYSSAGSFREELDESDITGVMYDADAELGFLHPAKPLSVVQGTGYQPVEASPRLGEA